MKMKGYFFEALLLTLMLALQGCGSTSVREETVDDGSSTTEAISDAGNDADEAVNDDEYEYPISDESLDMEGFLVTIDTEGMGQVARAEEGLTFAFDDEYPKQSTMDYVADGTKLVIGAKAYDDWHFVKWTLNGEDYSTDEQFTYTVTGDAAFVAVFDIEETE